MSSSLSCTPLKTVLIVYHINSLHVVMRLLVYMNIYNSIIYISYTCSFVHKQGSRQSCHSTRSQRSNKMESMHSDTSRRSKDSNKNDAYTSKYNHHEHMFSPTSNLFSPTRNLHEHIYWHLQHSSCVNTCDPASIHDPFDTSLRIRICTNSSQVHRSSKWNHRTTKSRCWTSFISNLDDHSRISRSETETLFQQSQ